MKNFKNHTHTVLILWADILCLLTESIKTGARTYVSGITM